MRVYLVRHGESHLNARQIHQMSTAGLSALGARQAGLLARRLAGLEVDTLLSSPYERARQTAEVVAGAVGQAIVFTSLLVELKRPSVIEGRHYEDPEVLAIKDALVRYAERADWRHSDEETFGEVTARARECLALFEGLQREGRDTVVAITHGWFLTMLVALMLYGDDLRPRDALRLQAFAQVRNTGITRCDRGADGRWTLVTWNDHAHLDVLGL